MISPTEAAIRVFAGSRLPFKKVPLLEPKSVIKTYEQNIVKIANLTLDIPFYYGIAQFPVQS